MARSSPSLTDFQHRGAGNGKPAGRRFALGRFVGGRTGKEWLLMKKKDADADPSWRLETELTPARLKALEVKSPPCETA